MEFGAAIFFTDYSMGPVELGHALEERGFDHSGPLSTHIFPCRASRRFRRVAICPRNTTM